MSQWQTGEQHPWELIDLYRGLLLWQLDDSDQDESASLCFNRAISLCEQPYHGITLRLIGAMIATVATCCYENDDWLQTALFALADVEEKMPSASENCMILREILNDPYPESIDDALIALPFNYH